MDSIIQTDKEHCFLCGQNACGDPLDKHHIFGGALRDKSEKHGLFVYIHHNKCHIFGEYSAHKNAETNLKLKRLAQQKAMQYYRWSEEDFRREYYKSYL